MKLLKRINAFTRGGERNRLADDMLDRQCGTTSCITIELAQDHTINCQRVMKCLGNTDSILSSHGIDNQECVIRFDGCRNISNLLHHVGINRQASCGINNENVFA